jgi:hypothetical protein
MFKKSNLRLKKDYFNLVTVKAYIQNAINLHLIDEIDVKDHMLHYEVCDLIDKIDALIQAYPKHKILQNFSDFYEG